MLLRRNGRRNNFFQLFRRKSLLSRTPRKDEIDHLDPKYMEAHNRLVALVQNFRENAHHVAMLDPFYGKQILAGAKIADSGWHVKHARDLARLLRNYPKLDLKAVGLDEMRGRYFDLGDCIESVLDKRYWTPEDVVHYMRACYANTIGVEYMHITNETQRSWLRSKFDFFHDSPKPKALLGKSLVSSSISEETREEIKSREKILELMVRSHLLETFLADKYPSSKRFGLAGCESLILGLKALFDRAENLGVTSCQMGMAHRGRLNVLVNLLQKPLDVVCSEFDGSSKYSIGDVRYHLGTRSHVSDNFTVDLVANPSHLEMVFPVVVGKTRAAQHYLADTEATKRVMPLLIHGDAAFSAQGIVAETMELSDLKQYTVGGSVHVIVNNRIGYTTNTREARSSPWCTNMAKGVGNGVPVFHVNGDDVEAVMWCFETAVEWRHTFGKDVIVDIVSYRRHGHDDIENPMVSNPSMYKHIATQKPLLDMYLDEMRSSEISNVVRRMCDDVMTEYDTVYEKRLAEISNTDDSSCTTDEEMSSQEFDQHYIPNPTSMPMDTLRFIGEHVTSLPTNSSFEIHPEVKELYERRSHAIRTGQGIDMGLAESLAFGTLLLKYIPGDDGDNWHEYPVFPLRRAGESTTKAERIGWDLVLQAEALQRGTHPDVHVRLSGQDCERGTFNQRHAVIVNQRQQQQQQQSYVPLNNLDQNGTHDVSQSEFIVCNSSLSEAAILAFEWGYSLENINSLVCWEAQFGDFANVAQAVVDESVVSAEEKWNVRSSLVMMLPHGHEGSGPDHSSARPERFLQAVNEDEDVMIQLSKNQEENISEIFRENNMDALALIEYLAREHNYYEENPELARAFSQRFVGEWMIKNRSLENEKDWIRVSNAWLRRLKEKECNIRVVNSTTPANTFHVLREQMHRSYLKPLILLTPKWLHTHRRCVSRLEEFSHGTQFERVLVDTIHKTDDENVERIVMVSGKLYYHLRGRKKNKKNLAIVRLEQIAPFPYDELLWVKDRFPNVKEWVYAQEEPKNMGCWNFVKNRVRTAGLVTNGDLKYIGRPPSASPATGSMEVHQREMMDIVRRVFDY